jgi:nickel transport protein
MTRRGAWALLLVSVCVLPRLGRAHEVLHRVEHGRAVAVRAYFADGEVLAYQTAEVFSPADAKIPWQKGRTDREGWIAFRPDSAGTWRVRVSDTAGHGLDLPVEVTSRGASAPPAAQEDASATLAFVLRPLLGVLVIALIFAALMLVYRKKRRPNE